MTKNKFFSPASRVGGKKKFVVLQQEAYPPLVSKTTPCQALKTATKKSVTFNPRFNNDTLKFSEIALI